MDEPDSTVVAEGEEEEEEEEEEEAPFPATALSPPFCSFCSFCSFWASSPNTLARVGCSG